MFSTLATPTPAGQATGAAPVNPGTSQGPDTAQIPGSGTGSRSYVPPDYSPRYGPPYSGSSGHVFHPLAALTATILVLALVAAIIVFIVLLTKRNAAFRKLQAQVAGPTHRAGLILAERLARGDITPNEYRRRMDVLRTGYGFTGAKAQPQQSPPPQSPPPRTPPQTPPNNPPHA